MFWLQNSLVKGLFFPQSPAYLPTPSSLQLPSFPSTVFCFQFTIHFHLFRLVSYLLWYLTIVYLSRITSRTLIIFCVPASPCSPVFLHSPVLRCSSGSCLSSPNRSCFLIIVLKDIKDSSYLQNLESTPWPITQELKGCRPRKTSWFTEHNLHLYQWRIKQKSCLAPVWRSKDRKSNPVLVALCSVEPLLLPLDKCIK